MKKSLVVVAMASGFVMGGCGIHGWGAVAGAFIIGGALALIDHFFFEK